jgi:hypothetical protein
MARQRVCNECAEGTGEGRRVVSQDNERGLSYFRLKKQLLIFYVVRALRACLMVHRGDAFEGVKGALRGHVEEC